MADSESAKRDAHYRVYESIWRNMDREDGLIHHRISWAILLSGGIFAASAILASATLATGVKEAKLVESVAMDGVLRGVLLLLMCFLSVIGLFFSLRANEGVQAAVRQLNYLKEHYVEVGGKPNVFEQLYGWPRPFGDRRDHVSGTRAAEIFPKLMAVVWGFAAFAELVIAVFFFSRAIFLQ